jgi:hypothetical protein
MTSTTFMVGLMLFTSATLGFNGCPQILGDLEDVETGDIIGDETLGDEDTSDPVDPDPNLGSVGGLSEAEDDGESSETGETDELCGDFAVQGSEECDEWNTNFDTCLTLGFVGGQLACNDDCTFDVSDCLSPGCGNGIIESNEVCDGAPYPCWILGYAGSTDTNGMAPCQDDCSPNEGACDPSCEWGQPGCFCDAATPCPADYVCSTHPQNWANAPGTCELPTCNEVGDSCTMATPSGPWSCCSGLQCVNNQCV